MGALPPIAPWIPEDDLRLRNAVESGASLESLAKGAVRFSRRFSLQELQDRWQALLYDPDTAAQASTYMVELELSASSLSSNRPGDSKGNGTPAKRKEESVCSHYFAMRKRIHSEHFNNMDLSFFSAPNLHNCTDTGNGCQEQLAIHNGDPVGNSMLGGPVTDQFGLHDPTGFDMVHHGFQQVTDTAVGGMEGSAHAFPNRQDTLEGGISDGIIGGNCLYGYGQNVTVRTNEAAGNDMQHSFERDSMHQNIPHVLGENILGENISVFNDNSCVQEMRPPQAMTMDNLFVNASLKTESLPSFVPTVNSSGNAHSGFGGNQGFSPPVSESAAFHQLGCSPSVSTMRMWRTIEDISPPAIPANDNHDDKRVRGTMVHCGDDAKKMSASGFDRVHPDPHSVERMPVDELRSASAILEGDFADISDSLLSFTNEEELFLMDVDAKDIIDRSCLDGLSSMLLGSPNDLHQDIPSMCEPRTSVSLDSCLAIPNVPCSEELHVIGEQLHSVHEVYDSEINVQSSTFVYNPNPEYYNGVICCTLNSEDPEVPCNEHVVFPPFGSSMVQHDSEEVCISSPSSTKDSNVNQKASDQRPEHFNGEGFLTNSWPTESQVLPEPCSNNPITTSGFRSELPVRNSLAVASRQTGTGGGEPSQCGSAPLPAYPISAGELEEDTAKNELLDHRGFDSSTGFLLEKSLHGSDHTVNHPQNIYDSGKQEMDVPVASQNPMPPHFEHTSMELPFSEPVANPSISGQEDRHSEDECVPSFSDVEAVILDMDLVPSDHESCFSREVSRYQYEETKRAIIRLEQGTHSCMQRAMTSYKAFAILYGRHLKHYIKKSEVLLGRATDDSNVDIDLTKEGRSNKISRRQALVKMEEDGSFLLKNLGKCSIFVNSKNVEPGHRIKLRSSCLIEIKSMRFVFEVNEKAVRQYAANIARKKQERTMKFEWSPEGF